MYFLVPNIPQTVLLSCNCLYIYNTGLATEAPPERMRGPSPTQGVPSPGLQASEEEFPQTLTVKTNGKSGYLGEMEAETPDVPLKGPVHKFARSQTLTPKE